jgi:GTP-binding protein
MKVFNAEFVKSSSKLGQCPEPDRPEYAFIGRSNVGKSSLLNLIAHKKGMAKTSGKPGKTTLINHFVVNHTEEHPKSGWYLVDLPGYGYAARAKTERNKWSEFTVNYLRKRDNLMCLFVLVDSRHEPQGNDVDFIKWLGANEVPFVLVFTKIDKLSKGAWHKNLAVYKRELSKWWENLPPLFETSSETGMGKEELLKFIEEVNEQW